MSQSRRPAAQPFSSLQWSGLFRRRQNRRLSASEESDQQPGAAATQEGAAKRYHHATKNGTSGSSSSNSTKNNKISNGDNGMYGRGSSTGNTYNDSSSISSRLDDRRASHSPSWASARPTSTPNAKSNSDSSVQLSSGGGGASRRKRRGSHFSILSPRSFYEKEEEEEQLHPLLTEVFVNDDDVAAFREALQDDAGQQEPGAAAAAAATGTASASSSLPMVNALSKLGYTGNASRSQERSELSPENHHHNEEGVGKGVAAGEGEKSDPDAEQTLTAPAHPKKIGRIAAASDFAPVRERTQRRRKKGKIDSGSREGFIYMLLRFPLLVSIFLTIALEFAAYVIIRQIVNVIEYFIAWRGRKGKLRSRLRKAQDAPEWREVALELDDHLGYEAWKREDSSGLYDWILVKKVLNSLRALRENDDADGVIGVLELCLRNNFAGTENFRLYSETFFGTKYLIESYLSEVEEALRYVEQTTKVLPQSKRRFYRGVQKNMGRTALCLSGGGSFGYYHIGLVRALVDANLLPSIISGTSAGGLIAALACTRTNDELKHLLVPELADRITACEEPFLIWGPRAYRTGARFDTVKWAEKAQFFTRGSMTFAEAYAKTGKVLNISVIPSDRHSPVKLLNYHTAPNCIIWSSLLASAAVPGIMNPVCLMQKDKSGQAVPWNWGHRFKDGSLRVDIPLQDLHSLFNVNYPIVSQVNPHVHLFFFAPKGMPGRPVAHRQGKGWRGGFILSASEHVLKLHLSMNFKIIRDLDLLPSILGQDWSTVFLQQFGGAVTIWPKTRAWDWVRILSDPDRKELDRMIRVGQSVTFPKLHMIENRVRLEKVIESGRKSARQALRSHAAAAATTADGPASAAADGGQGGRSGASSGAGGGGVETASTLGPSSAGGALRENGPATATQSDTDGTNDDFFSLKSGPHSKNNNNARGEANASSSNVRLRAQLRKLQGLRGLSSLHGGPDEVVDYATTPDDEGISGAGGDRRSKTGADVSSRRIDDGHGGFSLDSAANTPGELPRHIRARSMGLDDNDDELIMGDGDDQDPTVRPRMSHSSPRKKKGATKRGGFPHSSHLKDAPTSSWKSSRAGEAGPGGASDRGAGASSMQWLNSRAPAPEDDSSSSEEES